MQIPGSTGSAGLGIWLTDRGSRCWSRCSCGNPWNGGAVIGCRCGSTVRRQAQRVRLLATDGGRRRWGGVKGGRKRVFARCCGDCRCIEAGLAQVPRQCLPPPAPLPLLVILLVNAIHVSSSWSFIILVRTEGQVHCDVSFECDGASVFAP